MLSGIGVSFVASIFWQESLADLSGFWFSVETIVFDCLHHPILNSFALKSLL
jgi:hypothetical protein